ncbi:unnamed protein product [Calypogeia fissa]
MTQTRAQAALGELERAHGAVQVEVLTSIELGGTSRPTQETSSEGSDSSTASVSSNEGVRPAPRVRYPMGDREGEPVYEPRRAAQRARFQYKSFRGKEKEDPDEWLEDFVGTAKANGEDEIKLTTLAGVLKGEARPWYNGLPEAVKQD